MSEPKGTGLRFNEGKVPMELLPAEGLIEVAKVLQAGARKYSLWNWAGGMKWSICIGCIFRHLVKYMLGETHDAETGLSHMAHIACNALFLVYYEKYFPELDDRHPRPTRPEKVILKLPEGQQTVDETRREGTCETFSETGGEKIS